MRKIIFQMMISVDGFFEGPNKELDWHNVDKEFNDISIAFLDSVDTLIFGRITYELMASYWPTSEANSDDPLVTERMNNLQKIVFSKTLKKADWNNSKLLNGNAIEEIKKLKQLPGKDMAIFGSSNLVLGLLDYNIIDEYRLIVSPVILGKGTSLFNGLKDRVYLKLIESKVYNSGNVLLNYRIEKKNS